MCTGWFILNGIVQQIADAVQKYLQLTLSTVHVILKALTFMQMCWIGNKTRIEHNKGDFKPAYLDTAAELDAGAQKQTNRSVFET